MTDESIPQGFLERNNLSLEDWTAAEIKWSELELIQNDYDSYRSQLTEYAAMIARMMQEYGAVHSVRWRIKDTEHVLAKIVRKRKEKSQKYMTISADNYHYIITDLVGIRALHLFKQEAIDIDKRIRESFELTESELPIVYQRKGDTHSELVFPADQFTRLDHSSGYRSIHYILKSRPQKKEVFTEVQVRTIFEEGWSEIDHRLRYPQYDIDPQVEIFLNIFNRLAGQADEMGSFVKGLSESLNEQSSELHMKTQSLIKLEALVAELDGKSQEDKKVKEKLEIEVSKLKSSSNRDSALDYYKRSAGLIGLGLGDLQLASRAIADIAEQQRAKRAVLGDITVGQSLRNTILGGTVGNVAGLGLKNAQKKGPKKGPEDDSGKD